MSEVVGVRFKKAGKVYDFDSAGVALEIDDHVVVETAQGLEVGQVAVAPRQIEAAEIQNPLKPVLRKATAEDLQRCQELEGKVAEALDECGKLIEKMNLPMKLLSADYSLDGNRLTVYFASADRVDFRDLVRELARRLKVRVEMRQTGPRDEARMCGGCGRCGRPLCCASFLTDFAPVAMKMAKEQGLPLNPMKISGVCGRLMCCLGYENDLYKSLKTTLPKHGAWVTTPQGRAKVVDSSPLKQCVYVELETGARVELPVSDIAVDRGAERLERPPRENQPKPGPAKGPRPDRRAQGQRRDARTAPAVEAEVDASGAEENRVGGDRTGGDAPAAPEQAPR
jgi:cell fate regulator YaaT (PSP1 superfamily)